MSSGSPNFPGLMPIHPAGKEPLPPGITEDEREQYQQMKKWEGYTTMATESCVAKTVMSGGAGAFTAFTSCFCHGFFYRAF